MTATLVPWKLGDEQVRIVPDFSTAPSDMTAETWDGIGYDYEGWIFEADIGSRFNADNPQHWCGSDGPRFAIALAQYREDGDLAAFDQARARVLRFGYRVDVTKTSVRVVYETEYSKLIREQRMRDRKKRKRRGH